MVEIIVECWKRELLIRLKAVSGIMLTLPLTSMLTLAFNIQRIKARGTVYIRADGSIYPRALFTLRGRKVEV
jgi:hypothetical protein